MTRIEVITVAAGHHAADPEVAVVCRHRVVDGCPRSAENEDDALESIETAGRRALVELRRLLGILRRPDDRPSLAPVPGLGQIDMLAEQMREAGLPVQLHLEGQARALPPGVDLAAYRIVQEALTNTLKHAGRAQAHVVIRYRPHELELSTHELVRASEINGILERAKSVKNGYRAPGT